MSAETDRPSGSVSADEADTAAQPTSTVAGAQQTASYPAGTAMPEGGIPAKDKPEVLVGAAFAGGVLAAVVLRRIAG